MIDLEMPMVDDLSVFRSMAINFGVRKPPESLIFEYLAEGAANTIWTVSFQDPLQKGQDKSLVLRLRKNLPFTIPASHSLRQFEDRIKPLFPREPSYLLPQSLVDLSPTTIDKLNEELRRLESEGIRPTKRHNIYLPDYATEPYAIEMPNLYHGPGRKIEFKPKWLTQSPSAPSNARRCRTCALNTMRRERGESQGKGDSGFCPMALLSDDDRVIRDAIRPLWRENAMLNVFVAAFKEKIQPALKQLRSLQSEHNCVGLDDFENPIGKDFSVSMAIRDCSLFLLIDTIPERPVVRIEMAKFIDLDLKETNGGKLERWAQIERQLIEGGWYIDAGSPDVPCALSTANS